MGDVTYTFEGESGVCEERGQSERASFFFFTMLPRFKFNGARRATLVRRLLCLLGFASLSFTTRTYERHGDDYDRWIRP